MFEEKWKYRDIISLNNRLVTSQAFKLLMEYLYTGQVCTLYCNDYFNYCILEFDLGQS